MAAKAAALMHSLAGNHALVDGNKRLALLATADRPLPQVHHVMEQGRMPQPREHLPVLRRVAGIDRVRHPVQRHPLQHTRQAKAVIAMEMGDADPADLARRDPGEDHLPPL